MEVQDRAVVFTDRFDAGRRLASLLSRYRDGDTLVLALPRGGVQVGFEVARVLQAELDVFVARKIGAPGQPELGIGAVAPGGVRVLDPMAIRWLGITEAQIESIAQREEAEVIRRLAAYRGDRPPPKVAGRTVILVDDGLATGATARASLTALGGQRPARLVLAVPVAAPDTVEALSSLADEIVCVAMPEEFRAVGLWYEDFTQVTDEEVVELLERVQGVDEE